jgi:hypothetical protein
MAKLKKGMGFVSALRKTPSSYMKGAITGPFSLMRNPKRFFGETMAAFHNGNINDKARASAKILGTAAGATYVTRAIKGKSPFKDKNGKTDIFPYIPGV